eukprot:365303-Chlamydomonas_euryale.AAC.38
MQCHNSADMPHGGSCHGLLPNNLAPKKAAVSPRYTIRMALTSSGLTCCYEPVMSITGQKPRCMKHYLKTACDDCHVSMLTGRGS